MTIVVEEPSLRSTTFGGGPHRVPTGRQRAVPFPDGGGARDQTRPVDPGELACGAARRGRSVTAMSGPPDAASPLHTRLRRALPPALKARDHAAVAALRSALAAIDNAQAVEAPPAPRSRGVVAGAVIGLGAGDVPRRRLSESDIAAIVRAEVADRLVAATDYERAGQGEAAARLTAEADVLAVHLADA